MTALSSQQSAVSSGRQGALLSAALPRLRLLTNGRFTTMLTAAGSGCSQWDGRVLSRFVPDATRDADGYAVYLRDRGSGRFWSTGHQPTPSVAAEYEVDFHLGSVAIRRTVDEIASTMTVCVSPEIDVELRNCRITNRSRQTRQIELTTYAELVLHLAAAHAAHPAFSKLFLQTEFRDDMQSLVCHRRARQQDEPPIWAGHFLWGQPTGDWSTMEYETDRAQFLGRGSTPARPRAMVTDRALSGTVGNVLDPIFALRRVVTLPPGESAEITFALAAAASRAELHRLIEQHRGNGSFAAVCPQAEQAAREELVELGIAASEVDAFYHLASGCLFGWSSELDTPPRPGSSQQGGSPSATVAHSRAIDAVTLARARALLERRGVDLPAGPLMFPDEPTAAPPTSPRYLPADASSPTPAAPPDAAGALQLDNGYGGFSANGREYVIRVRPDADGNLQLPPMPWANVIANQRAGFIVTELGAGCTWAGNSRENCLTPWYNDPISDPPAEALYIRDEEEGVFWSPTPAPTPAPSEYTVRHGFGYTIWHHNSHDLEQEVLQFVPRESPVKLVRLRLRNTGDQVRRLSLFAYHRWVLGSQVAQTARHIESRYDDALGVILATNPVRLPEFANHVAFSAMVPPSEATAISHSTDRASFLGNHGSLSAPAALSAEEHLVDDGPSPRDPCAAWQVSLELAPGETRNLHVLLGETESTAEIADLVASYQHPEDFDRALSEVQTFWQETLSAVEIETPSPAMNVLVNGWLAYQNLCCRLWGRSSYYQAGGAFGYRDQLQDAAALVYHLPALTRQQILLHAAHQFVEGDVLHWWHPPRARGVRTRFSDDLLWLPLIAAEYVQTTGDQPIWDEQVPFVEAAPLRDGEAEQLVEAQRSDTDATLYEHCCRAIDISLETGVHGLPRIGCGDWNDGMSRVGMGGQGESVWMGFFLHRILELMLPVCAGRNDRARIEQYQHAQQQLSVALNDAGWDGQWYRRAFYDDGTPIGSSTSDECQIDALVQAWSVLSGVAPPERIEQAFAAVQQRLVDDDEGLIRLLTPAFDKTTHDPGYIKGYLPGIRENGGQYTHGVLWFVRAMAQLGRGTRAVELLEMLLPVHHTRTAENVAIYQTEPYVVAADVYGEPPHVGRGGWSWYTGSAGWMWRVAVESILGLGIEGGDTLVIDPRLSREWPACRLRYRLPDGTTSYEIAIENPHRRERGVTSAECDGQAVAVENGAARIPISADGRLHRAVVRL